MEQKISSFLKQRSILLLKLSLAVVFLWFGLLKVLNISPVEELIRQSYYFIEGHWFITAIGVFEVIIGLMLLFKKTTKLAVILLWLQMGGVFFSLVLVPALFFNDTNILMLTTYGEFIVKNFVILAGSLVVYAFRE